MNCQCPTDEQAQCRQRCAATHHRPWYRVFASRRRTCALSRNVRMMPRPGRMEHSSLQCHSSSSHRCEASAHENIIPICIHTKRLAMAVYRLTAQADLGTASLSEAHCTMANTFTLQSCRLTTVAGAGCGCLCWRGFSAWPIRSRRALPKAMRGACDLPRKASSHGSQKTMNPSPID